MQENIAIVRQMEIELCAHSFSTQIQVSTKALVAHKQRLFSEAGALCAWMNNGISGLIPGLRPAAERGSYNVTQSLIG